MDYAAGWCGPAFSGAALAASIRRLTIGHLTSDTNGGCSVLDQFGPPRHIAALRDLGRYGI
jgi:hypothetical protein